MTLKLPKIDNQDGSFMIVALLIMTTLAIAGLMVTNDALIESRVSRNYAIHKQCVMSAEAAAKEVMQGIDSIFENEDTSLEAIEFLDGIAWKPYDDYNTSFDFSLGQWSTYNVKPCVLSDLTYLTSVGAIAVLEDQTTSGITPGLGTSRMREHFEYDIYCRAEHAGAPNSEAVLVIGYRQEKI